MTPLNLAWVDVETTGLDPAADLLLEVGVAVTSPDLAVLGEKSWVVSQALDLSRMAPEIITMHGGSGLLAEVVASRTRLDTVDMRLKQFLAAPQFSEWDENGFVMCGSSVHFDREVLRHQLPESFALFGHRIIDVSSLKELVARWRPDRPYIPDTKAHRALNDARASIQELRYYRGLLFNQTSPA